MTGSDLLTLLVVVVGGGALIWTAFRLEPHWVSKDGNRFICRGQLIDDRGNAHGRWHEYRCRITDTGEVAASRRSIVSRAGTGSWRVVARSDDPPRRKAVFLLHPARDADDLLAVRMPANSRAVGTLDHLIER